MTDSLPTHPASTDSPAEGGDKPFAYFQFNVPWGAWEQVIPDAAGRPGVVAAYLRPAPIEPGVREKVEAEIRRAFYDYDECRAAGSQIIANTAGRILNITNGADR